MQKRNSIESPETEPHKHSRVIFDKGARVIQWCKNSLFNTWCWNNGTSTCKKKKKNVDTELIPFTKINSKWIPDLNVRYTTMKLLKDNMGENLHDLGCGNDCLDTTPKTHP